MCLYLGIWIMILTFMFFDPTILFPKIYPIGILKYVQIYSLKIHLAKLFVVMQNSKQCKWS